MATPSTKKIAAKDLAAEPNYFVIHLGYNDRYIMSHAAGMKVLEAMQHAERLTDDYNKTEITPIDKDDIKFYLLSRERYTGIKTAQLLGLSLDEVMNPPNEEAA